jgi:ABC-type sugar transport system ATPase subunit
MSGLNPLDQQPLLEARHVSKSYGHVRALRDASVSLEPGRIVTLVGDNGAGKSTLIKILTGAVRADSAEILVEGKRVNLHTPRDAHQLGITAIYQDLALFNNLDIGENVFAGREMVRRILGVPFLRRRRMAEESFDLLTRLGIVTLGSANEVVGRLSGGQRQMIAVARAIGMNARVLILDEPTAALGVRESAVLLEQVRRLRDEGMAIVLITHRISDAIEISDRIIVLKHGAIAGEFFPPACSVEEVADVIVRGALVSPS